MALLLIAFLFPKPTSGVTLSVGSRNLQRKIRNHMFF